MHRSSCRAYTLAACVSCNGTLGQNLEWVLWRTMRFK